MAVVRDWQQPLAEAVEKALQRDSLSEGELAEIRETIALLEPAGADVQALTSRLEARIGLLEEEYQKGVQEITTGKTESIVRGGIDRLKKLKGYKDSEEKIHQGEERIQQLKRQEIEKAEAAARRKKKLKLAALLAGVACVAVIIIVIFINDAQRKHRIEDLKAQVQELTAQEKETEIVPALEELISFDLLASELGSLTEPALEQLAAREGYQAAFDLRDRITEDARRAMPTNDFNAWLDEQLVSEQVSGEDQWAIAQDAMSHDRMNEQDERVQKAYDAYMRGMIEQFKSGERTDVEAWVAEQTEARAISTMNADTALQLCYTVYDLGYSLEELFPEGIRVDIPVGASVGALNRWYSTDEEAPEDADESKILPVAIVELPQEMYKEKYGSEEVLKEAISDLQKNDNHYEVILLTKYLMVIPEGHRAASMADCTCLLAMQQSYLLSGWTYVENQRSSSYGGLSIPGSKYYTNFRGYFYGIDAVMAYNTKNADDFTIYYAHVESPVISGDGWYSKHKDEADSVVFTAENMLGTHDEAALAEKYENALGQVMLNYLLSNWDYTQEDGAEAIPETTVTEEAAENETV